jgi:hypothetical protein
MRSRGHVPHAPAQPRVPIWERPLAPPQSVRDKALAMLAPEPKVLKAVQPKMLGLGIDVPALLGLPPPPPDVAARSALRNTVQALQQQHQQYHLQVQPMQVGTTGSQLPSPTQHASVRRTNSRLAVMQPGLGSGQSPARARRGSNAMYTEGGAPSPTGPGPAAEDMWEQPPAVAQRPAPARAHPPPFSHTASSPALLPSSALSANRQALGGSPSMGRRPP